MTTGHVYKSQPIHIVCSYTSECKTNKDLNYLKTIWQVHFHKLLILKFIT